MQLIIITVHMVLFFAPEPGAEKLCDAAGSQPFQHMSVVFLTLGAGGVAAGGHEALRGKAQQGQRVEHAVFVLLPVPDHALHAVVLQRRARLVQKLVAGDGDFALRVHLGGGHAVIGQHQHRAHHKSVRIPGEAMAQVPADGGDAARARAAEDAAGQKHLNRVAPVQIGPHAVHHGVELVGLALGAHVFQRAQQIGKEQYAQIGVPAEALAVFQIGLGAGEQRAGQQPVQRVARGHLADGGGAAAEIHAPPADGQARVKAGVLAGRGRQRGAGLGGGHDEREQTLNQLLVEMDGFAVNEGIIVIAATNRPDILDPALLRPGRFDRQITVNYPDVKGREAILKVHAKGKPLADEVSLSVLAKRTPGFTGADLENVLNEAAILAARYKKKEIGMTELEEAITRTVVGPEKRSHVITPEDKKITAYHEAGHAVVARVLPNCDPVHEISVIPRGRAAGYTMTMPEDDRDHMSRGKILDEIAMALGGRVAESIFLDDICTGAYSDLQKATELARRMVVEFGMSDEIGPVFLGGQTEVFIAKDWGHQRNFSEEVAARVDKEIRRILEEQYDRAKTVLTEHRDAMERIVKALIEFEHIDGNDFEKLFKGEDVELETFSDRRARIEKADEEVLAKEKAEAEAKAAAEAQEQSADGEGENK